MVDGLELIAAERNETAPSCTAAKEVERTGENENENQTETGATSPLLSVGKYFIRVGERGSYPSITVTMHASQVTLLTEEVVSVMTNCLHSGH